MGVIEVAPRSALRVEVGKGDNELSMREERELLLQQELQDLQGVRNELRHAWPFWARTPPFTQKLGISTRRALGRPPTVIASANVHLQR